MYKKLLRTILRSALAVLSLSTFLPSSGSATTPAEEERHVHVRVIRGRADAGSAEISGRCELKVKCIFGMLHESNLMWTVGGQTLTVRPAPQCSSGSVDVTIGSERIPPVREIMGFAATNPLRAKWEVRLERGAASGGFIAWSDPMTPRDVEELLNGRRPVTVYTQAALDDWRHARKHSDARANGRVAGQFVQGGAPAFAQAVQGAGGCSVM